MKASLNWPHSVIFHERIGGFLTVSIQSDAHGGTSVSFAISTISFVTDSGQNYCVFPMNTNLWTSLLAKSSGEKEHFELFKIDSQEIWFSCKAILILISLALILQEAQSIMYNLLYHLWILSILCGLLGSDSTSVVISSSNNGHRKLVCSLAKTETKLRRSSQEVMILQDVISPEWRLQWNYFLACFASENRNA